MQRLYRVIFWSCAVVLTISCFTEKHRPESFFIKDNIISYKVFLDEEHWWDYDDQVTAITTVNGTSCIDVLRKRHQITSPGSEYFQLRYYCDSANWCEDMMNYLLIEGKHSYKFKQEVDTDSLVYPFAMKVGDTLPEAWGKDTYQSDNYSDLSTVHIYNRKVVAIDSVFTDDGTYSAFRVESQLDKRSESHNKTPQGSATSFYPWKCTTWFNPEKGIIRYYQETPKLGSQGFVLHGALK